jgi:hypothetical protein
VCLAFDCSSLTVLPPTGRPALPRPLSVRRTARSPLSPGQRAAAADLLLWLAAPWCWAAAGGCSWWLRLVLGRGGAAAALWVLQCSSGCCAGAAHLQRTCIQKALAWCAHKWVKASATPWWTHVGMPLVATFWRGFLGSQSHGQWRWRVRTYIITVASFARVVLFAAFDLGPCEADRRSHLLPCDGVGPVFCEQLP